MDFQQLLTLINQKPPEIDKNLIEKVQVFVVDENTAIPYIILNNQRPSQANNDQKDDINREVLIVLLDFFDNFFGLLEFFQTFLLKYENLNILLFNYPGQAFTYFTPGLTYNNVYNATLLDLLLYELQKKSHFLLRSDNFRLLGFGNGANILCFFLTLHDNSMVNLKQLIVFNPFLYIDDMLADILMKSMEVFSKFPLENPELCFLYEETFSRQMTTKPDFSNLKARFSSNPISIEGRIAILKGVLENVNVAQNVTKLKTPIRVVFSQRNPLINVTQLDLILKSDDNTEKKVDFYKKFQQESRDLKFWFGNRETRQALILEEGGYNLLEDQREIIRELIIIALSVELKKNLTQRIALLDIKIMRLERKIVDFFMKYVEKLIEFTEDPFDQIASIVKLGTVYDVYREKFYRFSRENEENVKEFDWIYEEYRLCREKVLKNQEEFDEFYERNEKTLNIQTKKLADLKSNLGRISSEFLNPYRIAIRGLMFFKILSDIQLGIKKNKELFETFKQKIKTFDNNKEDMVILYNEKGKTCKNIDKNQDFEDKSIDRRPSLEKDIKMKESPNKEANGEKKLFKIKRKLTNFLRNCFEKIRYLLEVKAEVFENFVDQSEDFHSLEPQVLKAFQIFFAENIEFEAKSIEILREKGVDNRFIEEFIDFFRQMVNEMAGFIEGFIMEKSEDLMMFEGMENNEEKGKPEEESMNNIISESNISEFSSYPYLGNYGKMAKVTAKKSKENIMKGEEFIGFYERIMGRKWEKDEEILKEMERKGI